MPFFVSVGVAAWSLAWIGGASFGGSIWNRDVPSFDRINTLFQHSGSARFTPDGETLLFSVQDLQGTGRELRLATAGTLGSRPAGIQASASVLAVSRKGEVALAHHVEGHSDILARVPLSGGAPKDEVEGVVSADYGPNGTLAAVLFRDNRFHLEYPLGRVLLQNDAFIRHVSVSPDGRLLAILRDEVPVDAIEGYLQYRLDVVDLHGRVRNISRELCVDPGRMLWMPGGKELVVARRSPSRHETELVALDLKGQSRTLGRLPGFHARLQDMAPDGRILVNLWSWSSELAWKPASEGLPRVFRGMGMGGLAGLSPDGRKALYVEMMPSPDGTRRMVTFLLDAGQREPVKLWDDATMGFSRDGGWVLGTRQDGKERRFFKVPVGAGDPVALHPPLPGCQNMSFHPDGRRFFLGTWDHPKGQTISLWDPGQGSVRPLWGPEPEMPTRRVSPSGRFLALGELRSGEIQVVDLETGRRRTYRPLPEYAPIPAGWIDGDKALLISEGRHELPQRIHRLDLATGKILLWRTLGPTGGDVRMNLPCAVDVEANGAAWALGLARDLGSDLYVIHPRLP